MDNEDRLLFNILTFPVSGVIWIAEQIAGEVDRQFYDESAIRAELMELELRCDAGEITDEEYLQAEETLLDRLRISRERNQEMEETD
jgi:hypothetical protein